MENTQGAPVRSDLPRLVGVSVALVLCIIGAMIGSGMFGGPSVPEASDGALAADATLIAPGGSAFVIWTLIYLGLAAYTVWQWLPAARTHDAAGDRHRRAGWWVAASMLLNAAWLLTVWGDLLWLSVVVILTLAVVLGVALHHLTADSPVSLVDRLVSEGTFGVYLGWVAVATCANITAAFVAADVDPGGRAAEWIAVAVLVAAVAVVVAIGWFNGGTLGVGLAAAWGLGWIAAERLGGTPASDLVGWAAAAAAAVALVATVRLRARTRS